MNTQNMLKNTCITFVKPKWLLNSVIYTNKNSNLSWIVKQILHRCRRISINALFYYVSIYDNEKVLLFILIPVFTCVSVLNACVYNAQIQAYCDLDIVCSILNVEFFRNVFCICTIDMHNVLFFTYIASTYICHISDIEYSRLIYYFKATFRTWITHISNLCYVFTLNYTALLPLC